MRKRGTVRRALRGATTVAAIVGVLLVIVWGFSAPALTGAGDALRWTESRNGVTARAAVSVVILAGAALALVLTWGRATAPRRPVRLASGHGTITVAEVERRLEALWLERADVTGARALVENRHRRGVRVRAQIAVTTDARLDETAAAAALITEMLVCGRLGLDLAATPRFELRYRELDLRAGRAHDIRAARARRRDAGGDRDAG